MTTIANGFEASEPIPVDKAAGIKPIAAIIAVMITGRKRVATPSFNASENVQVGWYFNSAILVLNLVSKITPFCTQIPNKAMKPIPAEMLKLTPEMSSAKMPPTIAKGTLFNTSNESLKFPNKMKRIKKISNKLIGTACDNLAVALC